MKIFIIGASGLVGSNCLRHFQTQGWEVAGSYYSFAQDGLHFYNTLDPADVRNFDIHSYQPDVIVHCGALTHVDKCEQEHDLSYEQTVQSTLNIISLCQKIGARMVYLSTDYVFDGRNGPYRETDATNPISVYGKHKLLAEESVLAAIPESLVLRVTNIYGDEARGKNFVARILQQCKDSVHLQLKLPYDQYASPTNALDIAKAMWLLLNDGKTGIYHIGGTDYMNRVELALSVLKHFPDATYELIPLSTQELNQPALRPLLGGFVREKFSSEYPTFLFSTVQDYVLQQIHIAPGDA